MSIPDIPVLKDEPISPKALPTLVDGFFTDMGKYVVDVRHGLRRELLRWRGQVAELYLMEGVDAERHEACLRVLLQLRPVPSRQIPLLLGPPRPSTGN